MGNCKYLSHLLLIASCFFSIQSVGAQNPTSELSPDEGKEAVLIDEFTLIGSDDRGARIDNLYVNLQNYKDSHGLIVFYCGKICHYGEFEAHIRGINDKIRNRQMDRRKISIIFGGYKNQFTSRIWLIPKGGNLPAARSEFDIEDVKYLGLYKFIVEAYDCCALYEEGNIRTSDNDSDGVPATIKKFLESAPVFELRMQTIERDGKLVAAMRKPSEYKPNLVKAITEKNVRLKLLDSFYLAGATGVAGSACYLPSHTIIASEGEKKVEIEICFGCRRYTISGDYGTYVGTLEYDNKAESLFNEYLIGKQ